MILAQLGAEVIKVEPPTGDKARTLAAWAPLSSPVQPP
jgi:crotonobetainyl-CoA:carnitine CoA-transferase CaiB-like acyl-CoA transferase